MSAGAALFDFDNDGRLDILLLQGGPPGSQKGGQLFRQEVDGKFADVTRASGLDVAGYGMGAATGDINNDGLPDVLLCGYTGVRLFLNTGRGRFRDVTQEAHLSDPGWAVSAAFFDYDRDGRLDLVVANYVEAVHKSCPDAAGKSDYCSPLSYNGTPSRLYHNTGDIAHVRFSDVSDSSGIGRVVGSGLGVTTLDFNDDGWQDIFISNDARSNSLWLNQHDGTFKDHALQSGIAVNNSGMPQANMGIALGDLNGHSTPSIYVTHLGEEGNTLWAPLGGGLFQDATGGAGLLATSMRGTGFGTVMADFNNDTFPDLALVNGRIQRARDKGAITDAGLGSHWNPYAETNQLFQGKAGGKFQEISLTNAPFCNLPNVGRGLACGDVWNDGGIALLTNSIAASARLYRNKASTSDHWIGVRALDPRLGGRDAYGARLTLYAAGHHWNGWVNPAYSMGCSNDPRVHFGLGSTTTIEKLEVLWPDGKKEKFTSLNLDRINTIQRGQGDDLSSPTPKA